MKWARCRRRQQASILQCVGDETPQTVCLLPRRLKRACQREVSTSSRLNSGAPSAAAADVEELVTACAPDCIWQRTVSATPRSGHSTSSTNSDQFRAGTGSGASGVAIGMGRESATRPTQRLLVPWWVQNMLARKCQTRNYGRVSWAPARRASDTFPTNG
jgi:hypothetical protein